jgi:membrane associated rhomboid family serine protease
MPQSRKPMRHAVALPPTARDWLMIAIGCVIPIVLSVVGGAIGVAVGSTMAGLWGGVAGFVVGCAVFVAMLWSFKRAEYRDE